jgi:hypothetical protein
MVDFVSRPLIFLIFGNERLRKSLIVSRSYGYGYGYGICGSFVTKEKNLPKNLPLRRFSGKKAEILPRYPDISASRHAEIVRSAANSSPAYVQTKVFLFSLDWPSEWFIYFILHVPVFGIFRT